MKKVEDQVWISVPLAVLISAISALEDRSGVKPDAELNSTTLESGVIYHSLFANSSPCLSGVDRRSRT